MKNDMEEIVNEVLVNYKNLLLQRKEMNSHETQTISQDLDYEQVIK